MKYREALELMTKDIKEAQAYLENFPITQKITFFCAAETSLTYDPQEKKIMFSSGEITRPILAHSLPQRKKAYSYLPNMIKYCVQEESNLMGIEDILIIHNQMKETLGEV